MNINKLGSQLKTVMKTILSFLGIYEDWLLERVDVGKLQWSLISCLDYNHFYVFGKSVHQEEYKVLRKGLDAGLSKQQISNLFNCQEALGNIWPLTSIGKFSGVCNGKIQAYFYNDCQDIPDPSGLDPTQKNLLLMDDCLLPQHTIRDNSKFIILFPQDVNNLIHPR